MMSHGLWLFHLVLLPKSLSLEKRRTMGTLCLPWASSCFSSHVSPARLWLRPWNRTPPWRAWIWRAATSEMKGRRLGVWWGWGHEGRGSEEIAKEGARHGRMKVTWGKWGRQCNAALISRCIHPIEICDDKWLGYFDVLACIGQILVEQRNNNNCISKTGRPVIFKFYIGRATRFGMASQSYGFSGGWNGWRCWWLSQIVQEDHSGGRDKWQGLYTGQMLPQIIKTFT